MVQIVHTYCISSQFSKRLMFVLALRKFFPVTVFVYPLKINSSYLCHDYQAESICIVLQRYSEQVSINDGSGLVCPNSQKGLNGNKCTIGGSNT